MPTSEPDRAGAILTIDIGAVVANWRTLKGLLRPGADCGAAVKADAYGLGVARIAPALFAAGCRRFFVATIDEGIELRRLLPDPAAEIAVLCGPLPGTAGEFAVHRLLPVLNSRDQIESWAAAGPADAGCALHVDSGMNRLGLSTAETAWLAERTALLGRLRPRLLMSHLACAEDADDSLNDMQRAAFEAARRRLPCMAASLANSGGILLGPAYHFDLVRPGALLYGLAAPPRAAAPIAQVIRLQAKILQVRDVDSPMTVGYGATHRIGRKGRLATVAVGYADGYPRSLGGRGHAVARGVRVPVVGRVSMDLITIDITDVPPPTLRPGDFVDLIGPGHAADDVAAEAGTIGYEILTRLGRRYHRRYLECGG